MTQADLTGKGLIGGMFQADNSWQPYTGLFAGCVPGKPDSARCSPMNQIARGLMGEVTKLGILAPLTLQASTGKQDAHVDLHVCLGLKGGPSAS